MCGNVHLVCSGDLGDDGPDKQLIRMPASAGGRKMCDRKFSRWTIIPRGSAGERRLTVAEIDEVYGQSRQMDRKYRPMALWFNGEECMATANRCILKKLLNRKK